MKEELYNETKKNLVVVSNRSSDRPHICTSRKIWILGLFMHFDSAYKAV